MAHNLLSGVYELLPKFAKPYAENLYNRAKSVQSHYQYRKRIRTIPPRDTNEKNVVFLVVDSLRSDRTTLQEHDRDTTPFLSEHGIRFPNAISTAPWTYPSVPSLLTGMYPHNHGAVFTSEPHNWLGDDSPNTLSDDVVTLPEWLAASGYETYFETAVDTARLPVQNRLARPRASTHVPGENLIDGLLDWWDNEEGPRFGYVQFGDLHAIRRFPRQYSIGGSLPFGEFDESEVREGNQELVPPREPFVTALKGIYDTNLRYVDAQIERFYRELEERDELEDTILIVTGDHGEAMGEHALQSREWFEYPREHFGFGHGAEFFQESINVPLVVLNGQVDDERSDWVSTADIVPTVVDELDLNVDIEFDGVSLLDSTDTKRAVLAEEAGLGYEQTAVIKGEYKLLTSPNNDEIRLFDFSDDPREQNDIDVGTNQAIVRELQRHVPSDKSTGTGSALEISEGTEETLADLGYIE